MLKYMETEHHHLLIWEIRSDYAIGIMYDVELDCGPIYPITGDAVHIKKENIFDIKCKVLSTIASRFFSNPLDYMYIVKNKLYFILHQNLVLNLTAWFTNDNQKYISSSHKIDAGIMLKYSNLYTNLSEVELNNVTQLLFSEAHQTGMEIIRANM